MDSKKLYITQGDEKSYNLHFFYKVNGKVTDIDITGATVSLTLKRNRNDLEPAYPPVEVTNHTFPTQGKTTITLKETDTEIDLGEYYFDIQIKGGHIPKKTVVKGILTITWQVTEG